MPAIEFALTSRGMAFGAPIPWTAVIGGMTLTVAGRVVRVNGVGAVTQDEQLTIDNGVLGGCVSIQSATSAGLVLKASNGTTVATIGAGPGTGVTFAGGLNAQAIAGTTIAASDTFTSTLGTITTAKSVLSGSATWNNAAISFRGISLAVTNTASAASSRILSLSVGGAGVFDVTPSGAMVFLGTSEGWPDATADTGGIILRTGSSGSAPFNQAGSILYRARLSDVAGRGSHVFYTGATPTERVRIA